MPDGILPGISLVFSVANLYDVLSPENSSHIRTSYSSGDRTNALFCSDKTFTNSDEAHCSTTKLPISQLSRIIIRGSTEHSFMAGDLPVVGGPITMIYMLQGNDRLPFEMEEFNPSTNDVVLNKQGTK